ncbi:hypothetical protein [Gemmata sp.]|uniref:hypothetical protein n=1 Tax=Gemmata sp. TaxID=1914242 RepID=UPI003F7215ED
MAGPTWFWAFVDAAGEFTTVPKGGRALSLTSAAVTDADGVRHAVRGAVGFVDRPLPGGKCESRLAVRGRVLGTWDGLWRVAFTGGTEVSLRWESPYQIEYGPAPKTAA